MKFDLSHSPNPYSIIKAEEIRLSKLRDRPLPKSFQTLLLLGRLNQFFKEADLKEHDLDESIAERYIKELKKLKEVLNKKGELVHAFNINLLFTFGYGGVCWNTLPPYFSDMFLAEPASLACHKKEHYDAIMEISRTAGNVILKGFMEIYQEKFPVSTSLKIPFIDEKTFNEGPQDLSSQIDIKDMEEALEIVFLNYEHEDFFIGGLEYEYFLLHILKGHLSDLKDGIYVY